MIQNYGKMVNQYFRILSSIKNKILIKINLVGGGDSWRFSQKAWHHNPIPSLNGDSDFDCKDEDNESSFHNTVNDICFYN